MEYPNIGFDPEHKWTDAPRWFVQKILDPSNTFDHPLLEIEPPPNLEEDCDSLEMKMEMEMDSERKCVVVVKETTEKKLPSATEGEEAAVVLAA